MQKKISWGAALVLVLLAVLLTFQITYLSVDNKYAQKMNELNLTADQFDKLAEVDSMYRSLYVGEIDDDYLMDYIIRGYVAGSGDKYGAYYDKESFETLLADYGGEMQGIGINVIYNGDYGAIEVINVIPDSPALEAGVMPGDLIMYVQDGEELVSVASLGYYVAISRLQGAAGTIAEFVVWRETNGEMEELIFNIERTTIKVQSVTYHMYALDSTVGIIRISEFDSLTPEQFVAAVDDLTAQGMKKLVVDVRYNPGGELNSIVNVLDYLLPAGPIIRTEDKNGETGAINSDAEYNDIPMAVLVNGSTASAGELFASALQDYDRATLVGTVTYGKGTMQQLFYLSDGSGISISNSMYNPPFSENYEGIGVQPDIVVEMDEALLSKNFYKITDEEDNQLTAAVETFKSEK